jgi:hypothetical protein
LFSRTANPSDRLDQFWVKQFEEKPAPTLEQVAENKRKWGLEENLWESAGKQ